MIKNAKKIEVWQFEDENGDTRILLDNIIYYLAESGNYLRFTSYKEWNDKYVQHFAEIEAKESYSTAPKYVSKVTGKMEFSLKDFDRAYFEILDRLANMVDTNIKFHERLCEVEDKAKSSTTDKLLEVIHNLEKRIESLETKNEDLKGKYNTLEYKFNNLHISC